jgi:chemotaxis protein MotB
VHEEEAHENHERWLVSYADMMTLLMVLFIVMFAISQVDSRKFAALKTGLQAGFGAPVAILDGGDKLLTPGGAVAPDSVNVSGSSGGVVRNAEIEPLPGIDPGAVGRLVRTTERAQVAEEVENLERARRELQRALHRRGLDGGATFRFDRRGLVVSVATDRVLFASGSAQLLPGGRRILDALHGTLRRLPNQLSVDGHTNRLPIRTREFPSNWELSTDRAAGVLRYLADTGDIPVSRMSAAGFADTQPLLPPTDRRALVANRRVEIVVLARVDDSAGRAVAELGAEGMQRDGAGATAPTRTDRRAAG